VCLVLNLISLNHNLLGDLMEHSCALFTWVQEYLAVASQGLAPARQAFYHLNLNYAGPPTYPAYIFCSLEIFWVLLSNCLSLF
jgi:hypothetical protein